MIKKILIVSGLSLIAFSTAIAHTPSELRTFLTWLYHLSLSTNVINNAHLVVEHNGKYCPVVYRSDRSHARDDIKLGDAPCMEKSEYEKGQIHPHDKVDTNGNVTTLHAHACPSACGSQTIGSYVYNWCWKPNPLPPNEPKMNVDVFFGSPAGAHIDKYSANSSGRPAPC